MFYQSRRTLTPPDPPPKRGIARGGPERACGRVWRSFGRALGGSGAALGGSGGAPGGLGRALGGSIYTKTPDQPYFTCPMALGYLIYYLLLHKVINNWEHDYIVATRPLRNRALNEGLRYPCLWLRGIMPLNLTSVPHNRNNIVHEYDYKYDLDVPIWEDCIFNYLETHRQCLDQRSLPATLSLHTSILI